MWSMTSLTAEQLNYPVLMLGSQFFSVLSPPRDRKRTCSVLAFKKHVYENCSYIDANGNTLVSTKAEFLGYVPPFWGFRLDGSRRMFVDLAFEKRGEVSLEETKDIILQHAKTNPTGADPEWMGKAINSAKSFEQLFNAIK